MRAICVLLCAAAASASCENACLGLSGGCDALVKLGATCLDLETSELLTIMRATCDCTGCLRCAETDDFPTPTDNCNTNAETAAIVQSEADLNAALAAEAPCTALELENDVLLTAAATITTAVRLTGAETRPVLSPAVGGHRLVTVMRPAAVSMTSVVLKDGFDFFAGGCVFVAGGAALTLQKVALEGCEAVNFGGGVAAWTGASLRISQSTFVGNSAFFIAGTVYGHSRTDVVITDATTISYSGASVGGALSVTTLASLEISENVRVHDSSSYVNGGAMFIGYGAIAKLSDSTVDTCYSNGRGGGIYGHTLSQVSLKDCVIENCTANFLGGGAAVGVSALTVSDSTFFGCVSISATGGGVDLDGLGYSFARASFTNVDFLNCAAPEKSGGGLSLGVQSSATLATSRFVGCQTGVHGGAVAADGAGSVVLLSQTSILRCFAAGNGGALYLNTDCRASIDTSTLSENSAGGDGCVAAGAAARSVIFGGTRIERNVAANGGGLALLAASTVRVTNALISQNSALSSGGAATVGAGATLHLGRGAVLSNNVAASGGGAVLVKGKAAQLYVSASCSFVQVSLDWTAAQTLTAVDASVFFDYGSAVGPGRDARGAPLRFQPASGAVANFEACLPPGGDYELWAASAMGLSWLEAFWTLTLPPHESEVASVDARVTFTQAVNEFGVLGISETQAHGTLASAFYLDDEAASAVDGTVRFVGNVAVAGDGGGVSATEAGRAVLYEALLEKNVALAGSGGAVAVGAQSTAELRGVGAVANRAGGDGGAMRVGTLAVVDVYNTTATFNVARGRGGFAALDRVGAASLSNVEMRGNRAAGRGGGLALALCDQETVVVSHSTFLNNTALSGGGGLDADASLLKVEASFFGGNSVESGSGGGVSVQPTGAALALEPQPEECVALLRVVVDWRLNSEQCEIIGSLLGTALVLQTTCDVVTANCDQIRTLAGDQGCRGCTCKANSPGQGESHFHVYRVNDGAVVYIGEPDAGAFKAFEFCLEAGEYEIVAYDLRGDAWYGGTLEATVMDYDGRKPFHRAAARWNSKGNETDPLRLSVDAGASNDLAVKFVDNTAFQGGGAAVFWTAEAPAGLEAASKYSSGNDAGYGSFAATPATRLLINSTLTTVYAVPNAAMPAISVVMVDRYGHVVSSDSTTAVNADFIESGVQASGLVAVCVQGVATFDAITITGSPGEAHQLRFLAPTFALETLTVTAELTPCPVGFVERVDAVGVSCIPCEYTKYYAGGRCLDCPEGAACQRYDPLDASSATVGYQLFTVETLPIKRGYYRFYATSGELYECADKDYCEKGDCACAGVSYDEAFNDPTETHGSRLCAANAAGPLCGLCEEGYFPRPSSLGSGGGCAKCEGGSALPIFFAVVFASLMGTLIAASGAAVACAGVSTTRKRVLRAASFAQSRWFLVSLVQVWYALSTVSRFVAIEKVDYPEPLQTVLQYLGFLSFDLSFVVPSMQCFYNMSYFELFLAWTLFPFAFGSVLFVGVFAVAAFRVRGPPWPHLIYKQLARTEAGRKTRQTAVSLFCESFSVSETEHERWLTYNYEVRCGGDVYRAFEGAASALIILYVFVVPASLALKLKMNRINGVPDGSLDFFTRHVRPAYWYYEILALEVRLIICGALVPVTGSGLRLSIILVVIFAWTTVTRDMRPYINRGHMALVNFLQIFILSCILLALILHADLLSDAAAEVFAAVVAFISITITVRLYSAFKNEEVSEVMELVRERRPFDRADFMRLHVGMNVRVMDDCVFAAALAILDDEVRPAPADALPGWAYLKTHLMPLQVVWTHGVPTKNLLATHEPRLLSNAALLSRTRRSTAGGVTLKQFTKDVNSILGPLANELRGDVVSATFDRFWSPSPAQQPTLDYGCFEPALRAVVHALVHDHASDDEDRSPESAATVVALSSSRSLRDSEEASLRDSENAFLRDGEQASLRDVERAQKESSVRDVSQAAHRDSKKEEKKQGDAVLEYRGRQSSLQGLWPQLSGRQVSRVSPCGATARLSRVPHPAALKKAGAEHTETSSETFSDLAMHAHAANFRRRSRVRTSQPGSPSSAARLCATSSTRQCSRTLYGAWPSTRTHRSSPRSGPCARPKARRRLGRASASSTSRAPKRLSRARCA
ncbi:hypothetical protein M885DRAFT_251657 [Pelagophyceae sp. CCMP2097]|nr:hypothetical protein M885DRAFT_251657 [Pelagophyceae sp. CCMP2097]